MVQEKSATAKDDYGFLNLRNRTLGAKRVTNVGNIRASQGWFCQLPSSYDKRYTSPGLVLAASMKPLRPISPGAAVFLTAALCPTPPSLWGTARAVYGLRREELVEVCTPSGIGALVGLNLT